MYSKYLDSILRLLEVLLRQHEAALRRFFTALKHSSRFVFDWIKGRVQYAVFGVHCLGSKLYFSYNRLYEQCILRSGHFFVSLIVNLNSAWFPRAFFARFFNKKIQKK